MDWERIDADFAVTGPAALEKAYRDGDDEIELRAVSLAIFIGIKRIASARAALPDIDIFDEVFLEALVGEDA